MAYSKFTSLTKFCKQYHLQQNTLVSLFGDVALPDFSVSERLKEDLQEALKYPLYTEKAKSELLIMPILKEIKRKNDFIALFSGFALNIEGDPDLNGNPDFILSANPNIVEVQSPIFCLMESKNKTPDEGFAQCAAEMYAAKRFNEEMETPQETIYGAVSNAYEWVFLRFHNDCIYIDAERYYLSNLNQVLSILQYIVNIYKTA
jgi:hypothetical protein